jgi:hypothetical protein
MATGSRGEKRPSAVIGGAIMVARIATEDAAEELRQRSGRVRSGQAGAKARAERSAVARKAAGARWG